MKQGFCGTTLIDRGAFAAAASLLGLAVVTPMQAVSTTPGPMLNAVYFCAPEGLSLEECAELGVNVITHQPREPTVEAARAYIKRAHTSGIRVLPYVSAEKAWDDFMAVWPRNSAGSIPYYLTVQPKEHREWVLWRPDGKYQIRYGMYKTDESGKEYPFWPDSMLRGAWYMCANAAGYPDAVLEGCRKTIELGADGLFIDNASADRLTRVAKCAGPEQGRHQHLYPDKDNAFAYVRLLHQIRDLVKSYGPDKIAFYNGGVDPAFEDCRDADMLESYICNASQDRWHNWDTIKSWATRFRNERATGRVVTVLSYITGRYRPVKEDLYYCFACALWSGFLWGGASGEDNRIVYRARLGQPVGELVVPKGMEPVYRVYENGIVAVNPGPVDVRLKMPLIAAVKEPVDLYSCRKLEVQGRSFETEIPRESGRVYVDRAVALRAHLEEARLNTRRLLQQSAGSSIPHWNLRDTQHANGQGEVSLDTTNPHSGKACLKVVCEGTNNEVHAHQGIATGQTEPAPLRVQAWARVQGEGRAVLVLGVRFADGTHSWWSLPSVTAKGWTLAEDAYRPEKAVQAVTAFCTPDYAKAGTAWFDDITVLKSGGEGRFSEHNLVVNPGFEEGVVARNTTAELEQAVRSLDQIIKSLNEGRSVRSVERELRALPELVGAPAADLQSAFSVAAAISAEVLLEDRRLPLGGSVGAVVKVFNGSASALRVTEARFDFPAGLEARPALRSDAAILPGKTAALKYAILRTGEFDVPYVWFRVVVRAKRSDGHTLALPAAAAVWFGKPIELTVERPSVGRGRTGDIVVVAANRTPQAIRGCVVLSAPDYLGLATRRKAADLRPLGEVRILFRAAPAADAPIGGTEFEVRFDVPERAGGAADASLAYVPGSVTAPSQAEFKTVARENVRVRVVPVVAARRVGAAPRIDGRLDDPSWQSAGVMRGFYLMDGTAQAQVQSTAKVVYDDAALYVGIQCSRSLVQNIRARARPGAADESAQVVQDDHIELFVDPGWTMKNYVRLCCNAIGGHKTSGNPEAKWRFAARQVAQGYIIEAALAFAGLKAHPKKGDLWGLNISRMDSEGAPGVATELSCWSPTGETFHNPVAFGSLVFE